MSRDQILRSATLRILDRHSPIGTGSLVKKLQQLGLVNLQPLWKLLEQLRADGIATSEGPPARQIWSLVRDAEPELKLEPIRVAKPAPRAKRRSAPQAQSRPARPALAPAPAPPPPTRHAPPPELEDPADFLFAPPPPPPAAPPEPEDPRTFAPAPTRPARRGRPPGAPRTTKFKSLTRCDYADHSMVGYQVRVIWRGQRTQAFFADADHGDRLGALAAALDWRDRVERTLGKPRTEQPIIVAPPSNTGIEGVSRTMSGGRPVFQVSWSEGGRMRRTSVAITKHGEAEALRMATLIRARDDRPGPRLTTIASSCRHRL